MALDDASRYAAPVDHHGGSTGGEYPASSWPQPMVDNSGVCAGVHPRRWTDCRLGIDRNLPGFQGWKPWPSTAPAASNSSVRSPWNTLRARPCIRVVIDTTVQPKAVMFPTDAELLNRARERLVRLTKKLGGSLRQSYARVGKLALIKHQRYAHAHQFKRANRSLRKLKTYLGRVIRDIERRSVVLPHPEGPSSTMNSPSRASRLTPLTAVISPNCFLMSM